MTTYYRTRLGNIITSDGLADSYGYVSATSVLTGRPYGPLRLSALRPATAIEIQRAEAACLDLANSPAPPHDCELARARSSARTRLGIEP